MENKQQIQTDVLNKVIKRIKNTSFIMIFLSKKKFVHPCPVKETAQITV